MTKFTKDELIVGVKVMLNKIKKILYEKFKKKYHRGKFANQIYKDKNSLQIELCK